MTEQREASKDAVMTRIGQAIMLLHAGDREEARNRFGELWSEIGEDGDALHRCTLAHYMADAQDDPGDELAWDLRALTAAGGLSDERAAQHPDAPAVRAFYPSLHLNLAADYVKLRRPDAARIHLDRARAASGVLADDGSDDGYGGGVRAAIERLELRLREL
ncbi:hypothetical protein OHU11_36745 [Streptomyces sp. NBC_00257]|uniref:hypothetical protein n=2 Tax=Streptomyces TaxID=1883 RepID=UPI0021A69ED7|nr:MULTISPECIES: hypothetical protein [Streptomyces]WTB52921.1 hypothetical protein OG832_06940 [Streptomyces sp. NBC_00826]WTH94188.1 hypothetical protein OIC43_36750 [Streptomyces sp. NBC_00825]WTI02923.1 hypothetical protein OHA23_36730 [Streptomyces sp. NBC_00822]MCT2548470.1 hypothetical protein [Streptomyces atratus]MCX4868581.1 hypothetical protein [Streptomyces sp. NBC_00906]